MKSYRLSVLGAVAFAVACGAASNPDVAAKAGNQQLSVTRLAEILGQSQAPLEKDVARSIAELWVNYQLVGLAAAKGDSLSDPKVMEAALWSSIENIRVKKFYDAVSKGWSDQAPGTDEQRYNSGEAFAARLGALRDADRSIAFVIGGADGLDPRVRAAADLTLAFGPMTWPHLLVRVMLAEQIFRAQSILAGHPYHRA